MTHPVLRVQFLGDFKLVYGDAPLAGVNSTRLQSLLAYLILHADTPQPRQHLAFRLWPDTTEAQARNNLRQFFYQLRHTLPHSDRFLMADAGAIGWKTDEDQIIDIHRFERALSEATAAEQRGETDVARQALAEALAVYQGDLLPGCYDDWLTPERERLQRQAQTAGYQLVTILESQRNYPAALPIARRLI